MVLVEVSPHEVIPQPLTPNRKVHGGNVNVAVKMDFTNDGHLAAISPHTETSAFPGKSAEVASALMLSWQVGARSAGSTTSAGSTASSIIV